MPVPGDNYAFGLYGGGTYGSSFDFLPVVPGLRRYWPVDAFLDTAIMVNAVNGGYLVLSGSGPFDFGPQDWGVINEVWVRGGILYPE